MPQIASTLSCGNDYAIYHKTDSGANPIAKVVSIKGGANVARRGGESGILTPQGIITTVTDEELEALRQNEDFNLHEKNGFIKVLNQSSTKVEKAVKDMKESDDSAPLKEADFTENGGKRGTGKAPKMGKIE